jgi:hypothetical protein
MMINLNEQVQERYGKQRSSTISRVWSYVKNQKVMYELTFADGVTKCADERIIITQKEADEKSATLFKLIGQAFADEHQQAEETE